MVLERAQEEEMVHWAEIRMVVLVVLVGAHVVEGMSILAAFDRVEDHYEMNPYEEVAGHSATEGVGLVVVCMARQDAYVARVEVDFGDHVCQIHAMLHMKVELLDRLVMGPSKSSHDPGHP